MALKLKSLTSKPQVLENCPVLGSRTALFLKPLKFCWKMPKTFRKICEDLFCIPLLEITWKKILKTFFFGEHLRLWPWFLASSIPVLGLKRSVFGTAVIGLGFFFVSLALASRLVSSTPPLVSTKLENLSNSFFLTKNNFNKVFLKGICYILLIDMQNVVRAFRSSYLS